MAKETNEYYEQLISSYKKALESDTELSLAKYCRNVNANESKVIHWAGHHGIFVRDLRMEVLVKLGKLDKMPTKKSIGDIYASVWADFKETLERGENVTFSAYCILRGVNVQAMHKWVVRKGYSIMGLKAGLNLNSEFLYNGPVSSELSPMTQRKFGQVLKDYKLKLRLNPAYSMLSHCKTHHVDYKMMMKWMAHVGLSVKQLKQAVILDDTCPRVRKHVFVQFKPNGGTDGDRLTGVKIRMADGSSVSVEECTVISLCAFIHRYNSDQKREVPADV